MGPGAINFPEVMQKLRTINAQIANNSDISNRLTTPASPGSFPQQPTQSLLNLFPRGHEDVDCYFGPILFAVPRTSVLVALAEARLFSCNDAGPKRIAMRRSEDYGSTWSGISFIWNDTSLQTLPTKQARWAQWREMGGTNCKCTAIYFQRHLASSSI